MSAARRLPVEESALFWPLTESRSVPTGFRANERTHHPTSILVAPAALSILPHQLSSCEPRSKMMLRSGRNLSKWIQLESSQRSRDSVLSLVSLIRFLKFESVPPMNQSALYLRLFQTRKRNVSHLPNANVRSSCVPRRFVAPVALTPDLVVPRPVRFSRPDQESAADRDNVFEV